MFTSSKQNGRRGGDSTPALQKTVDLVFGWVGEDGDSRRSRLRGTLKWVVLGGCVWAYVKHAIYIHKLFLGNSCDDAYISFRYLRLLVDHGELAYNLGERVEGYSNLLWILMLVPFDLAGVEPSQAAAILGLGLGSFALLLACIGARTHLKVRNFVAQLAVGMILASSGYYAAWSIMGLESMLHGALLLAALLSFMRELKGASAWCWSAVWLVGLAATRPEGLLVAAGALIVRCGADYLRRQGNEASRRSIDLRFYWVLLLGLGVFEIFRVGYFGWHLWPNAVRAKVGGSSEQYLRGWDYVRTHFVVHYSYLFVACLGIGKWLSKFPARSAGSCLFLGYVAFYALAGGDWSVGRFFAPLLPVGAMCFGSVIDDLLGNDALKSRVRFQRVLSAGLAVLVVGFLSYFAYLGTSRDGEQRFATGFARMDARRVELGKWIAEHTAPDTSVALYAAGQIAYYSDRYAHDMLGLNDAHIASIEPKDFGKGPAGHEKFDVDYTLNQVKPTIIVQPNLIPGMINHPTFKSSYQVLPPFPEAWVLREYWDTHHRGRP